MDPSLGTTITCGAANRAFGAKASLHNKKPLAAAGGFLFLPIATIFEAISHRWRF
jgi:hypothetical protein